MCCEGTTQMLDKTQRIHIAHRIYLSQSHPILNRRHMPFVGPSACTPNKRDIVKPLALRIETHFV